MLVVGAEMNAGISAMLGDLKISIIQRMLALFLGIVQLL
jgi:uncharacterized membrane protein required for colicin V production